MSNEVTELVAALNNGDLTLDEVARRFRDRNWPDVATNEPQTYLELAANSMEDPAPNIPGSFDDVTVAYDRGEISSRQYQVLSEAVAESINAEAQARAAGNSGDEVG